MIVRWASASALLLILSAHGADLPELTDAEKEKITALIARLGDEDFDARQSAAAELRKWDVRAQPLLRAALEKAADIETSNKLKTLLARFETHDKLKRLAADYNYDPDKVMVNARVGVAKPTRESQTLLHLAGALYRRRQANEKDDEAARQRAMMAAQLCDKLVMIVNQTRRLPADIDDRELKSAVDEFVSGLSNDELTIKKDK